MIAQGSVPLGYEQLADVSSATTLTVPAGANFALINAETANVRWRDDGTAPTASVGMLMLTTDMPLQYSGTLSVLQFIAATGSPKVNVTYYKLAL